MYVWQTFVCFSTKQVITLLKEVFLSWAMNSEVGTLCGEVKEMQFHALSGLSFEFFTFSCLSWFNEKKDKHLIHVLLLRTPSVFLQRPC